MAGFTSAAKPQVTPHQAHCRKLEVEFSLSIVIRPKAKAKPERHVSHGSQGMNKSGGAAAQAHPATIPAVSWSCSLPNGTSTHAVREAKTTLNKIATMAEALVSTPKRRKMQARKAG
jgi:hypothetical protein